MTQTNVKITTNYSGEKFAKIDDLINHFRGELIDALEADDKQIVAYIKCTIESLERLKY